MRTIEERLAMIEDAFQQHALGKINDSQLCKNLGVLLSSLHADKAYDVSICNQNQKEKFFGMRIFPGIDYNDTNRFGSPIYAGVGLLLDVPSGEKLKISFKQFYDRWKSNKRWMLEIDASALDAHQIGLNPKELTAMILHEMGHVVYGDRTVERIYNAFMDIRVVQSTGVKFQMKMFDYLFYPVVIMGCKYRQWIAGKDEMNVELFADKNVVKLGYGEHLQSAFLKVVQKFGKTDIDAGNAYTQAESAADMVGSLSARHNRVGQELYIQAARTNSHYIQTVYRYMMVKLGFANRNRYTGTVTPELPAIESLFAPDYIQNNDFFMSIDAKIAVEGVLRSAANETMICMEAWGRRAKSNKNLYREEIEDIEYILDRVVIDIDNIKTSHDKMNILDRLYEVRDALALWDDRFDETLNPPLTVKQLRRDYGSKIQQIKDKVKNFTDVVLVKKIPEARYEVFVKYPAGYEG